jgi:hypothetical protein
VLLAGWQAGALAGSYIRHLVAIHQNALDMKPRAGLLILCTVAVERGNGESPTLPGSPVPLCEAGSDGPCARDTKGKHGEKCGSMYGKPCHHSGGGGGVVPGWLMAQATQHAQEVAAREVAREALEREEAERRAAEAAAAAAAAADPPEEQGPLGGSAGWICLDAAETEQEASGCGGVDGVIASQVSKYAECHSVSTPCGKQKKGGSSHKSSCDSSGSGRTGFVILGACPEGGPEEKPGIPPGDPHDPWPPESPGWVPAPWGDPDPGIA